MGARKKKGIEIYFFNNDDEGVDSNTEDSKNNDRLLHRNPQEENA